MACLPCASGKEQEHRNLAGPYQSHTSDAGSDGVDLYTHSFSQDCKAVKTFSLDYNFTAKIMYCGPFKQYISKEISLTI